MKIAMQPSVICTSDTFQTAGNQTVIWTRSIVLHTEAMRQAGKHALAPLNSYIFLTFVASVTNRLTSSLSSV